MADYEKMYCRLCSAVDTAISELKEIPAAAKTAESLVKALLDTENIYIDTYAEHKESS